MAERYRLRKRTSREPLTLFPAKDRFCALCKCHKPVAEFGNDRKLRDGLSIYCLLCDRAYKRARSYGLSIEEVRQMWEAQDNRCRNPGCRAELVPGQNGSHIDHDHTTGKVRGILCPRCNKALGFLRDDLERIQGLIDYLTN